jgi:2-haloacid dehalogenase
MLLAFDMFGTLADTSSVKDDLESHCGDRALEVAKVWRAKQLEYMFRVTAMGQFPTFGELTLWGLVAALEEFEIEHPRQGVLDDLVDGYRHLKPFQDVPASLADLHERGHTIIVFSVGPRAWLHDLVASYDRVVDDIVSAEDVGVYKPHPDMYRHLLNRAGAESSATIVVSSNPFDLIGASATGIRTVWCKRDYLAHFDPWGQPPDHIVAGLSSLAAVVSMR